ncbi:MAG: branched-chain amino acid ABC transporter permease [Alphaproteobacteria bacterium]|nr:branched-chain amino acid ABC transporter permease [Alphaproteobacteria bacterium]
MPLDAIANIATAGLLTGLVYGLSALGLSAIFGVTRIVNFAHGELMVIGMYGALLLFQHFGLAPLWAIPIVGAALFAIGYALQAGLVNRLLHAPEHMQFLLMAALAIMLVALCLMAFGPNAQNVTLESAYDSVEIGVLILDAHRVYAGIAAIAVAGLLFVFFRYHPLGKAIRACADNLTGAAVVGLNVKRLFALTFGIGSACIGAAGCIILMLVDVHPYLANTYTLLAFVVVIIGGMGSLSGALLGGLLVGVSEALAGLLLQPSLKSMFSFGLLILVLILRPEGLLGRRS